MKVSYMMTSDSSFCQQRQLQQMFNMPLTRFTPANPYSSRQFTKMQLDMRRKAEILKYSANKSSSQTNNLTKKEAFAKLVKGGANLSTAVMESNKVTCTADNLILTPTTSSDVPGPVMYLYNDETVPLYNYSDFNTRTYPDYVQTNIDPWQFVVLPNTLVSNNGTSIVYYLIINSIIDQPYYTYNITMPVGLTIAGSGFSGNITFGLNNVVLTALYNDGYANETVLSLSNYSLTIQTSSTGSFSANKFIGNIVFSDIKLYTLPTYVYKFVLTPNITYSTIPSSVKLSVGLVANITLDKESKVGCTITSTDNSPYISAAISGK